MIIGSYGSIVFQASSNAIETFQSLKWTSAAFYQQHKVHGKKVVPEFTGFDNDKITLDIMLSAFLGINPQTEMDKLQAILTSKKAHVLVLGTTVYGSKWLLSNISRNVEKIYRDGTLLSVKVQITLMEQG